MTAPDAARSRAARWLELAAFVAWGVLVGALTLTPVSGWSPRMSGGCLLCGEVGGADLVRNVLMFMPAGVYLARRGFSVVLGIGIGLLLSASIELAQWFVPGRHASARDVIVNGLGVGVGAVFYLALRYAILARARAVLIAAAALPVLGVAITGWLYRPVSTDGEYYAQWVPRRPYYARWNGALLGAEVNGIRTPIGRMRETAPVRSALERGGPVALRLRRGQPTPSLTAFYVVMDDIQREVLMIGGEGDDLVVRPRIVATDMRLDHPDLRFANYLARWTANDTLALEITTNDAGRVCVRDAAERICAARPSLGAGWAVVMWQGSLSHAAKRALDAATTLLLLAPLALIAAGAGTRRGLQWLLGTGVAMTFAAVLLGLDWPRAPELAAFAVAVAAVLTRRSIQRAISA